MGIMLYTLQTFAILFSLPILQDQGYSVQNEISLSHIGEHQRSKVFGEYVHGSCFGLVGPF